jgi:mannose-6-phosphate isomerase-like protein (cupin superfamily)
MKHLKLLQLLAYMPLLLCSCNKMPDNGSNTTEIIPVIDTQFVFSTNDLKRYKFPTHINDLVIDRANSSFSEVFVVIIEPGKATNFHKHDDTEQIFYMISGTGVLTITDERKEIKVKPGDVVRIPLSTYHSIKTDENNTVIYLCIDSFGQKSPVEPTWEDHVKVVCKANNWDFNKVVSGGY